MPTQFLSLAMQRRITTEYRGFLYSSVSLLMKRLFYELQNHTYQTQNARPAYQQQGCHAYHTRAYGDERGNNLPLRNTEKQLDTPQANRNITPA